LARPKVGRLVRQVVFGVKLRKSRGHLKQNPKHEIRISKLETNSNAEKLKIPNELVSDERF
jgi:hypothetical protein